MFWCYEGQIASVSIVAVGWSVWCSDRAEHGTIRDISDYGSCGRWEGGIRLSRAEGNWRFQEWSLAWPQQWEILCALIFTSFQIRGHAMFSDEGRTLDEETLEYAWLLEIQLGKLGGKVTAPQVRLVNGCEPVPASLGPAGTGSHPSFTTDMLNQ
jgi:hypothetical protein